MDDMNIPRTGSAGGRRTLPPDRPFGRGRSGPGARWLAGLAAVVVLAGGSVIAVSLIGSRSPQPARAALTASTSRDTRGGTASGGTGHGTRVWPGAAAHLVMTRLRACAASARGLRAVGHRAAARARPRSCLRRFLRPRAGLVRLARRALHGQITFATKAGPRTIAFERGSVQSLSSGSVVVKAADGTAWTWQIGSATLIVKAGRRVGPSALAAGQRVFVIGRVTGGSDDARRIVIRG